MPIPQFRRHTGTLHGCATLLVALLGCGCKPAVAAIELTAQPSAASNEAVAHFEFSASAAEAYTCSLDGATATPCSSPHTLIGLGLGTHSLRIQAFDGLQMLLDDLQTDWSVLSAFAAPVHPDLATTEHVPAEVEPNGWRGILRINCDFSHAAYDDPLVFPGQPGAAHYHNFYGYLGTDAYTSNESLYRAEADADGRVSSCQGNRLNRSAYWVPALLAPLYIDGERQLDAAGEPAWQVVDAVVGNSDEAHEVFYYSAAVDDLATIQPPPAGLHIIAGRASTLPGEGQASTVARWHCQSWNASDGLNPDFRPYIPECVAPDRLRFDVFFPSCWNGTDLDSADHQSHMAYPETVFDSGMGRNLTRCPATHPVALPRVSYHYAFGVRPENVDPASNSSRGWRLAADGYVASTTAPGGYSLHADWINGWHPEVMQVFIEHCIRAARDCHDGELGNGWRLSNAAPGVQLAQAIINQGLGTGHDLNQVFIGGFEASQSSEHSGH